MNEGPQIKEKERILRIPKLTLQQARERPWAARIPLFPNPGPGASGHPPSAMKLYRDWQVATSEENPNRASNKGKSAGLMPDFLSQKSNNNDDWAPPGLLARWSTLRNANHTQPQSSHTLHTIQRHENIYLSLNLFPPSPERKAKLRGSVNLVPTNPLFPHFSSSCRV